MCAFECGTAALSARVITEEISITFQLHLCFCFISQRCKQCICTLLLHLILVYSSCSAFEYASQATTSNSHHAATLPQLCCRRLYLSSCNPAGDAAAGCTLYMKPRSCWSAIWAALTSNGNDACVAMQGDFKRPKGATCKLHQLAAHAAMTRVYECESVSSSCVQLAARCMTIMRNAHMAFTCMLEATCMLSSHAITRCHCFHPSSSITAACRASLLGQGVLQDAVLRRRPRAAAEMNRGLTLKGIRHGRTAIAAGASCA